MEGLALFLWLFDPGGGEGEGIDVVGLVGVGFGETGAGEGLGGVWDEEALEGGDDVLDEIEDIVAVGFGRCFGGSTGEGLCGNGDDDIGLGETAEVGGLGIVDGVKVDEAARPLDGRLGEVELTPVLVDVL